MSAKRIGVAGHAGVGHTHGYGGFIQDDSGGFVTVGAMLRHLLDADTRVAEAEADVDANTIHVATAGGGTATTSPRRGITPSEARLIRSVMGQDALFCQTVAVDTLGRMYGQGVLETPVALQAALANAVVDTFRQKDPAGFLVVQEDLGANRGLLGGTAVEAGDRAVSYLVSVNYTAGGLGPAEDLEGNLPLGAKRSLMGALDMLPCPTIVVEGKAYLPAISDDLQANTFLVRAQEGIDNPVVARALVDAARELGHPVILRGDLLPRAEGSMARGAVAFADRVVACASKLRGASLAAERVAIVAELARLVSEDAGAITCISDAVHDVARGVGMIPGTAATLSLVVTRAYRAHWKIPLFDPADAQAATEIVGLAIEKLAAEYDAAQEVLEERYVDLAALFTNYYGRQHLLVKPW